MVGCLTVSGLSQLARRRADARPALVLLIVCAGVVLASLDLFIVNVALPQMATDFHVHGDAVADLSWVLNAYAIVYAALLVLFGRGAERYPRELGFLVGVSVFVAASAACAAATSVTMLVAFRVVQAAGAALLTPTSLGLILATSPPERRHGAVRAWTAVGGLLVTGGVGALVLGLVKGASWGWSDPRTLAALAGGAAGIGLFIVHLLRSRNPLIDRALFRLRPFTGASAVAIFFSAAFGAMLLSRVLWMQDVWHWSALTTGLAIAPGPLMVPLFAFALAGPLAARFGAGAVIATG